ncbi:MAG: metalloregulator ArsR/SmtB family transcription factor [Candidatus Dormibacteraeota bacterium]|nr:metalloregulator ArsR/SmtB family transcription factor [Candidatus Dormibacteraeota bacterium]
MPQTSKASRERDSRAAKTALFDEFARLAQALANGRRLEIVDVLGNGERTVDGIASETGLSVANASQHLQVLREARLVRRRRDGTRIYYTLQDLQVFELWRNLRTVAAEHRAEVRQLAEDYLGAPDTLEPVTGAELLRRLKRREDLVVLDVRPAEEFEAGHLPSAISIPLAELGRRLRELPRDREVVAYCRGPYCAFAHKAVRVLRQAGFRVTRLEDGLPEWKAAGLPVVASLR